MRHAALDLTIDNHRIDQCTAVVHHVVINDAYTTGLDIDFHLHRMRTVAIGRLWRSEVGCVFEAWHFSGRQGEDPA